MSRYFGEWRAADGAVRAGTDGHALWCAGVLTFGELRDAETWSVLVADIMPADWEPGPREKDIPLPLPDPARARASLLELTVPDVWQPVSLELCPSSYTERERLDELIRALRGPARAGGKRSQARLDLERAKEQRASGSCHLLRLDGSGPGDPAYDARIVKRALEGITPPIQRGRRRGRYAGRMGWVRGAWDQALVVELSEPVGVAVVMPFRR